MVEDRVLGMKSRGVYESPAMTVLYDAYDRLKQLCLKKEDYIESQHVAIDDGDIVYKGVWFREKRYKLDRLVDSWKEAITGHVMIYIFPGGFLTVGAKSPNSLYSEEQATMEQSNYDPTDVERIIAKIYNEARGIRAQTVRMPRIYPVSKKEER